MNKDKLTRYLLAVAILLFWQCIGYFIPLPFSPIFTYTNTSSHMSIVGTLIAFFSAFIADIFLRRYQKAHPRSSKPARNTKRKQK
ncbi:MAG: hypothetical protein ABF449_06775 [Ethanoligenens sp.]|uniref:hypothetical protein n=1 Tax=Ethanoligenens sp. TaxID=2099655 RepID=UPI0039EBACA7